MSEYPIKNVETALAHLEAFVNGGDELGDVSEDDAIEAVNVIRKLTCRHKLDEIPPMEDAFISIEVLLVCNSPNCDEEIFVAGWYDAPWKRFIGKSRGTPIGWHYLPGSVL